MMLFYYVAHRQYINRFIN